MAGLLILDIHMVRQDGWDEFVGTSSPATGA